MNLVDKIPNLAGHWRLDVFEGDVEREPLTRSQVADNALAIDEQRRADEALAAEFGRDPVGIYLPIHVGRLRRRCQPYKVIEGENLVTTAGKGLLLDRLFAMGTPPTQINSMGVGNSATAAVVGDTQLLGATPSPTLLAFDALPTRASLVVTAIRTFATGEGNMTWNELGMFNGTTNGTSILLNRISPIGPFGKTSATSIVCTVTLTQA